MEAAKSVGLASRKRPLGGLLEAHAQLQANEQRLSTPADLAAWEHQRFSGLAGANESVSGIKQRRFERQQYTQHHHHQRHDHGSSSSSSGHHQKNGNDGTSSVLSGGSGCGEGSTTGGSAHSHSGRNDSSMDSESGQDTSAGASDAGRCASAAALDKPDLPAPPALEAALSATAPAAAAAAGTAVPAAATASTPDLILMAAWSLRGSNRSTQFCSVCLGIRRTKGELFGGHRPDGWCPLQQRRATADEKRELRRRRQKLRRAIQKRKEPETDGGVAAALSGAGTA